MNETKEAIEVQPETIESKVSKLSMIQDAEIVEEKTTMQKLADMVAPVVGAEQQLMTYHLPGNAVQTKRRAARKRQRQARKLQRNLRKSRSR